MGLSATGSAFILVVCAGLCTSIGSSVVFFPQIAALANRRVLAFSLGLAAGVMIYVALVDIYNKAVDGFAEIHEEGKSFIYATLSFFFGCFVMMFLNWLVKRILGGKEVEEALVEMAMANDPNRKSHLDDPLNQLEGIQRMALEVQERENGTQEVEMSDSDLELRKMDQETYQDDGDADVVRSASSKKLKNMGFAMALAIAVHNFPEGLVTFASYVENPAVGIALAVSIAIHNIPEGLCVSMPIYHATGRRCYAFWWGVLSGLSEPLGALIGWGIFQSNFGGNTYGIMFGIVSGMMTIICVDELLPTAYRFDPKNDVTTYSFLVGAFMIALSLMLFNT